LRKESTRFERLYHDGERAQANLVAGYAAAAERARADDRANAARVTVEQDQINRRSLNDFEARLADARARAQRLRQSSSANDRGAARNAAMPSLPGAARSASESAGQDGLPDSERLIATEQAIQLDGLIKWVKAQAAVAPSDPKPGD
jgi:hypothetical protein